MSEEKRVITVRRTHRRVGPNVIAAVKDAHGGFIVDAIGREGALDHRIKPITSKASFSGSALTVQCRPWDNLAAHVALEHIQPGDVLAISTRGFEGASVIGEKLIGMAKNKGAVAVVVDGMARDSAGIDRVGIPVFTRGITANSSHKDGPGTVALPISLGGVSVSSGDLLVGDADGVICVPSWQFDLLVARLSAIVTAEHAMFQQILERGAKPAKMAAVTMGAEIRYID